MQLDRQSHIPLYRQLYTVLRRRIERGELEAGDTIPPEKQLMADYQLSRVTTRKALQLLADEDFIVRQPGKGTFVALTRLQENLSSLRGFAELMRDRYPDHVMEVHSLETTAANQEMQRILEVPASGQLVSIKRRHVLDEQPLAYVVITLPYALGSSLTVQEVASTPIYTLLMHKLGVVIKRARQTISAIAANAEIAAQLRAPEQSPVLCIKRVTYSAQERPIEYIELFYPGERHELVMDLHRDSIQLHTTYDLQPPAEA